MKITIAKKIAFSFFVILVLLIGMIGITYQGFKKVTATLDAMELESVKRGAAGNLRFNITQLLMASNDYITTQKQYYQREFDRLDLVVDNFYHEFNRLSLTDEEQRLSLLIKQDLDSIRAYSAQIFSIPNPRQSPKAWALMETMDYRFGEEVNKKTTQIFDGISRRVEEYRRQAATVKENAMKLIFGGTFLGIFISIGVSFLTVRRISKPIIMVAKAADSIANGDYSHRVIIKTHDEVAFLAKSFNVMAESIQRSQKALKESKRLTEVIVSTVPIGLFVFDENGKILSVNNAFCKNFGLEQNHLLGQNIISMFEKLKAPEECRDHILSYKPMSDIECNYSDTVKGARIINLTICPIPLTEGESLLVVEDITKRKHDEQIVINNEKHFRALIENSNDGLCVISPDGHLLYESPSNKSITGYEHNELINKNILPLFHPDDLPAINDLLVSLLEQSLTTVSAELRFLHKDGRWLWVEAKWKNALNESAIGGIVINYNDITERKKFTATLQQQLNFTNALNEISSIIISSEEKEVIIQKTTDILGETLDVDRCLIYDVNFPDNQLTAFSERLNPNHPDITPTKGVYPIDLFISGITEMKETKQYLVSHFDNINPILLKDNSDKILHGTMEIKSALWYPFAFYSEGYHLLALNKVHKKREWTREEIDFLESVSKQVSMALEKIRLLDEKTRADKLLIEQSNILQNVLDDSPIGIWMLNDTGRMKFVNKTFCGAVGIPEEKFLSAHHYAELYDETTANNCMHSDAEAFALDQPYTSFERVKFVDGQLHDLEIIKKKVTDKEGNILGLIGISMDVTERKRAEEALRHSEERYRTLYEDNPSMYFTVDPAGTVLSVNQYGCEQLGFTAHELVGQSVLNVFHDEDKESALQCVAHCVENLGQVFHWELRKVCQTGTVMWVKESARAIQETDGQTVIYIVCENINERKHTEEEIISQKNKFAQLFNNSPIAIALLDAQDRVSVINESFSALFGYYIEEIEGKALNNLIVPPELREEAELYSTETMAGNQVNKESYRKKKDGSLAYVQIVGVPVIVNDIAIGFYGMYVDLTHIKKAEEELIKAKEKAEEMNRLKSNFLSNMSHELRTPLNGILGYASILTSSLEDNEFAEMAQTIYTSGKRLSETLNLILDLSKAETEKLEVVGKIVDVASMVKSIINFFSADAESKNLVLESVTNAEEAHALLDENLFERAVGNLIGNAIKFTEKGKITVEVGKELYERENWIYIKVKDTGIGIPEDKINLIWEEFRQASEGMARHFEGTGLGLTISKRIVELMNGKIAVESKVGVGSIFTVRFPASDVNMEVEKTVSPKKVTPDKDGERKISKTSIPSILYVEDDFINQNVVRLYLGNLYSLETVYDGVSALDLVNQKEFDLILMDINLGGKMDGMAVTREIRKIPRYADTPIIAVTAYAMESDKTEFLSGGCTHFLAKPFEKHQLLELLAGITKSTK